MLGRVDEIYKELAKKKRIRKGLKRVRDANGFRFDEGVEDGYKNLVKKDNEGMVNKDEEI